MSAEVILFWLFASGIVLSAAVVVVAQNPIVCAMSLVGTFFFLAGVYVLLWAHTIAVIQVLVYAGAIMVLFLFVIMLLSLTDVGPATKVTPSRILGALGCAGLFGALALSMLKVPSRPDWATDASRVQAFGSIEQVGKLLYTSYLLPFEAVSLLLLSAIVGAVVVAKSRI